MKVFFWKPRIFRDRFKQLTLLAGTLCVLIVPDGVGGLDGVRAGHFQNSYDFKANSGHDDYFGPCCSIFNRSHQLAD